MILNQQTTKHTANNQNKHNPHLSSLDMAHTEREWRPAAKGKRNKNVEQRDNC
jgi:hypothetical protein